MVRDSRDGFWPFAHGQRHASPRFYRWHGWGWTPHAIALACGANRALEAGRRGCLFLGERRKPSEKNCETRRGEKKTPPLRRFSAVQSPPFFEGLRPLDRAFPRMGVALTSSSARSRARLEQRQSVERRARRRIIRSATTPKQGLNALFSFFPFAFELSSPSSPPLFTFDALAAAARARSSATGLTPRERSHGVAGVWTKERGAARGGGGTGATGTRDQEKKGKKKVGEEPKKNSSSGTEKNSSGPSKTRSPFFRSFLCFSGSSHSFFSSFGADQQQLCCSPWLAQARIRPRRRQGPGTQLLLQEQEEQLSLPLLVLLLSSRPRRPRRRPGFFLLLVAGDDDAPPSHRRRRRATVRFLLNSRP